MDQQTAQLMNSCVTMTLRENACLSSGSVTMNLTVMISQMNKIVVRCTFYDKSFIESIVFAFKNIIAINQIYK